MTGHCTEFHVDWSTCVSVQLCADLWPRLGLGFCFFFEGGRCGGGKTWCVENKDSPRAAADGQPTKNGRHQLLYVERDTEGGDRRIFGCVRSAWMMLLPH